ncbi:multicopper oxidase family protein [Lewinella sp. W8]|uniref:multicopper oxidase family protein n=1 Tax=Lewinella sp. W8 TaxID=2528208 RepID=UPI0010686488|nr:multicopper oxidase domain-containing protein [Lewinella sp. W8]MTB52478.1 multicopper oxidase domain-containing protein [Lewinella sp. W8]
MKLTYLTFFLVLLYGTGLQAQEFVNEILIPPLINDDNYHLNAIETQHNFNPNGTDTLNTMVRTFAFEDANNPGTTTILGPTLTWGYLKDLTPSVTNNLSEVTTCHWHGAHVPQFADGGPHQRIQPGDTWNPFFKVLDKSATMWYHPHAMGLTYKHVQMGLSGMIIVEDPVDGQDDPILSQIHRFMPVDYGVNDFPLIFQTKKFKRDDSGAIVIQADDGFKNGYYYMVNGIVDPVLRAPASMIRLRLLNGDGKFSFNFKVKDANGNRYPAHLIATDAGYTTRTYQLDSILMSPGERTEFLIDLRGLAVGTELFIENGVDGIPAGIIGNSTLTNGYAQNRNLLKIVVKEDDAPISPIIAFPLNLHPSEEPPMSAVTRSRTKTFRRDLFDVSTTPLFNIDSTLMDMMVVNDVVKVDSTELWTIDNTTNRGHPWHIHDTHFWVTEIIDAGGNALNPNNYPEIFGGPKDNVLVQPGWKLTYIASFPDFGTQVAPDSSYMYHCHILPHEDNGMMGQFVVWNGIGNGNPTSIRDNELSTIRMDVFPNPAREVLYLDGTTARESTLKFIDMNGRLVKELRLPGFDGAIELSTDGLPSGMLIMDWQTAEGRGVSRVLIK